MSEQDHSGEQPQPQHPYPQQPEPPHEPPPGYTTPAPPATPYAGQPAYGAGYPAAPPPPAAPPGYGQQPPAYGQPPGYGPPPGYAPPGYGQQPQQPAPYGPAGYQQPYTGQQQAAYQQSPYQQGGYATSTFPAQPAAPRKKGKGLLWTIVGLVVVIVAAVLVTGLVAPGWLKTTKLSHTAVESYIETQFGAKDVSCNSGSDVDISKGKTFTCSGADHASFTVTLTDDKGGYSVNTANG